MSKTRLENLSDGVFAIVFTILVLEIRVPETLLHPSSLELHHALLELAPIFLAYFVSFAILTIIWLGHSFFFNDIVRIVNRQLVLLNMLYLAFVALIPFSTYLLGRYPDVQFAVLVYGFNVLMIGIFAITRLEYALYSREIDTSHNNPRHIAQSRVRTYITPLITIIGMFASSYSIHLALILFAFPIVFNIIPGILNGLERILGFRL